MTEYPVELYEKNDLSKPYLTLFMEYNTITKAAIEAAKKLKEAGFVIGYKEVWNATIINSEGEDLEILKNGEWTINRKTGKKLSNLEEKLNQD